MPSVVSDGLQGKLGIDQLLDPAVAESVRAGSGDGDARLGQVVRGAIGCGSGSQRPRDESHWNHCDCNGAFLRVAAV